MIGRLEGRLVEKNPPELLVDVNGVGYEVQASMNTVYQLPAINERVCLHIHFVVREDAQILYGFFDKTERSMFRTLIKVNGVGPKLALTILSSVTPHEFSQFVVDNNSAALVKLPGVGKKTAERLIVEMRDKLKEHADISDIMPGIDLGAAVVEVSPEQEAISALVSLGYKPQEASRAISRLKNSNLSSEEIIRQALQGMVKS